MLPYKEGTLFGVPLRRGGYGVGVVARTSPQGKILLAYLFGPAWKRIPSVDEVKNLRPQDALRVARVGDLSLIDKTWPIIGQVQSWRREEWPMPPFVRYEELTGRSFRVVYDDDDPDKVLREELVPPGTAEQGPKDGLMGAGFVEKVLTSLLAS